MSRPMFSVGTNVMKPVIRVHDYQVTGMTAVADGVVGPSDMYDQSRLLVVPHLGFAMPIGKGFSAGIAAYVPYGLDIQWKRSISQTPVSAYYPSNRVAANPGAYNSYRSWYMREVVSPTVAYKFNDKISIGAGISLGKSKSGLERLAFSPISSLNNKRMLSDLEDDFNWSFNVGLMYQPIPSLAFGLTYRGKTKTDFEGTTELAGAPTTVSIPAYGLNNIPIANTKVHAETEIDHPDQVQVGMRYIPNDKVSVEADVVWTHWSMIDDYTVKFDRKFLDAPGLGALNPGRYSEHFARDWDDTIQFRLGAEWKVIPLLTLRGSYVYDPSPIPDDTMDLQWPDADKHTFALGTGLNFGSISIDATVQYSWIPENRKINGESSNLSDSYRKGGGSPQVSFEANGHLWGGALTVNYKF